MTPRVNITVTVPTDDLPMNDIVIDVSVEHQDRTPAELVNAAAIMADRGCAALGLEVLPKPLEPAKVDF